MTRTQIEDPRPILVVGSTGKTGRRVAALLEATGLPVRHGSRQSATPFDWSDPQTWAPALEGARAAYVTYHPDLAAPGAPEAIRRFAQLALEAGLEKMVLLSGRGETEAQRSERILADSGLGWTVVRASWFAQNFSEAFLHDMVVDGVVALPVSDVREPFIDVDDIAEVAVEALLGDRLNDQVVEVTGPRLMTFAEATREVAERIGRPVQFVSLNHEEFLGALVREGVPGGMVQLLDYLFTEVLDGRNQSLTDGVERALGRKPRDFAEYAAKAAAAGAWEPQRV